MEQQHQNIQQQGQLSTEEGSSLNESFDNNQPIQNRNMGLLYNHFHRRRLILQIHDLPNHNPNNQEPDNSSIGDILNTTANTTTNSSEERDVNWDVDSIQSNESNQTSEQERNRYNSTLQFRINPFHNRIRYNQDGESSNDVESYPTFVLYSLINLFRNNNLQFPFFEQ
ncbi:MAG: hypothetical protein N4A49_11285 [Marinifilaceae bacterium]|jgi:hypothetical protein|nr:hypothetical protein [Marinifilaceae bacterium]